MQETSRWGADLRAVAIDTLVEPFLESLRVDGHAKGTLSRKQTAIAAFAQWIIRQQGECPVIDLGESHLAAFAARTPLKTSGSTARQLADVRGFLRHLRTQAVVPRLAPEGSAGPERSLRRYVVYLRQERGLTERSIAVYTPYVRSFLAGRAASGTTEAPDAGAVRDFILERVGALGAGSESMRLVAVALRSFLRFLFYRGETSTDLSSSVPTTRRWRQAAVPSFLSPEEVERVLAVPDRECPRGRRAYAILLLLARLGLRAGDVVALELGDIQWRTAEITLRGKGRRIDHLPLHCEVGDALVAYLRDRVRSTSRRVFLREIAPRVGLSGPSAIGAVVRCALAGAGLRAPRRCVSHLFRHSLASRLLRQGASMDEIAEVLRHRSPSTTAIYAKVDFETLRSVARSWPVSGSVR
jgi:site-specific recombinase XerD